MLGARGQFIYAEGDGWLERMLVRRIGGLCVRLVLIATLGHRPFGVDLRLCGACQHGSPSGAGGVWWPTCSGGSEAPGLSLRSWRLGGTQPGFLAGISSVLPGAAQVAIGLMTVGAATSVQAGGRAEAHGSSHIGFCFRGGRCSCSFSGASPTESRSAGVRSRFVGAHNGSLPPRFPSSRLQGAVPLLIARRRTSGALNTVTGTGRSSSFDAL